MTTRYRCSACGNLPASTWSRRSAPALYHYSVGGDLTVEDEEVLDAQGRAGDLRVVWGHRRPDRPGRRLR